MKVIPSSSPSLRRYAISHIIQSSKKIVSATTKLRVAFDSSAKTSTGFSLNVPPAGADHTARSASYHHHKVPRTQLCYHRRHRENVQANATSRPPEGSSVNLLAASQRRPPRTYRLQTVTYGLASSAFLATRTSVGDGRRT
jgi:hypothetical protein